MAKTTKADATKAGATVKASKTARKPAARKPKQQPTEDLAATSATSEASVPGASEAVAGDVPATRASTRLEAGLLPAMQVAEAPAAPLDFPPPLFLLAPPRSFTSVICGVLGQHPELFGTPELNLFRAPTMSRFIRLSRLHVGMHRLVAQLYAGEQTIESVIMARHWLLARAERGAAGGCGGLRRCGPFACGRGCAWSDVSPRRR